MVGMEHVVMRPLKFGEKQIGVRRSHSGSHSSSVSLWIVFVIEYKIVHSKDHAYEVT